MNYDKVGQVLGLGNGLVLHPEHALEPTIAYRIMSYGMRHGSFTGKGLSSYIQGDACDYLNARRIINGLDQAGRIQGYAQALESVLTQART
jgi:putative chitinase